MILPRLRASRARLLAVTGKRSNPASPPSAPVAVPAEGGGDGSPPPLSGRSGVWIALFAVLFLAFAVRLVVGLPIPLEGDESTAGLGAWHIAQGQVLLMEPNAHYQGTMVFFILAPFEVVLGHSELAIRVGMASIGTAYVAAMYLLGRCALPARRDAVLLAAVAAGFPFFAILYGDHARTGYGDNLLLQALFFALVAKVGWNHSRWYHWAFLGLVAGLGLWGTLLFAAPLAVGLAAVLARVWVIGARQLARGFAAAACGLIVGFSPWIAFNVRHGFASLHSLPTAYIGVRAGIARFYDAGLPIFLGTAGVLTPLLTLLLCLALVSMALLWRPRVAYGTGRLSWLQPLDAMFVLLAFMALLVTATRFNGVYLEPRYFLPAAIPLVAMATLALRPLRRVQLVPLAILGVFLVASGITTYTKVYPQPQLLLTGGGGLAPIHFEDDIKWLQAQHPDAVFADYWLERPLAYLMGESIPMAPYNGYLGFPAAAAAADAADHPDYLFFDNDPSLRQFERVCSLDGVSFTRITNGDRVLYHHLSRRLLPEDFGWRTL